METKFNISILYDINKVFPENSFTFLNSTEVHFTKGKVFVTHKAYGKDVTVWFKGNGELTMKNSPYFYIWGVYLF